MYFINSFIKQYYEALATRPETLFRFYKEDSSFSFNDGPQASFNKVMIRLN